MNPVTRRSDHPPGIPATLDEALSPSWLSMALSKNSSGDSVASVETIQILEAMACKARIAVTFGNQPGTPVALCIKGFFSDSPHAGTTMWREAQFYLRIASHVAIRTPSCAAAFTQDEPLNGILILADLVAGGMHFCSAHDAFDVELVSRSLEQIARLHSCSKLLEQEHWIPCRLNELANRPTDQVGALQSLMHDERRGTLPQRTLNASLLLRGIRQLSKRNADRPQTLLHGDSHGGNLYLSPEGPGFADWQLIQRGSWALDVAYHIAATLPEEVAKREERQLLAHYLDKLNHYGGKVIPWEQAWEDFRCAQVYGYYHWAITSKVAPPITNVIFRRLGAAVTRLDSYRLLGL